MLQGQSRRQHVQGQYVPNPEIRDPLEGQELRGGAGLRETTREVLKCGGRCFKCFQVWTPEHHKVCPGRGKVPSMKVSERVCRRPVQRMNVVHKTCSTVRQWSHMSQHHPAVPVPCNHPTAALHVPVPKVQFVQRHNQGQSHSHPDPQSDRMLRSEFFLCKFRPCCPTSLLWMLAQMLLEITAYVRGTALTKIAFLSVS